MNRKQRRAAERQQRKRERTPPDHSRRVVIVGENLQGTEMGVTQRARPMAEPPPKVPGKHRWVATVAYNVSEATIREHLGYQQGGPRPLDAYFDNESMISLALGCVDCERILAPGHASPDTPCPAGDEWSR